MENEFYSRNYYILRNKTSNKYYVGQRKQNDVGSNYFGSGVDWSEHCEKNGGKNKENIELVELVWFEEKEKAQQWLDDLEEKEGEYWKKENDKFLNLIPEHTNNCESPTKNEEVARKISETKKKNSKSISEKSKQSNLKRVTEGKHNFQKNVIMVDPEGNTKSVLRSERDKFEEMGWVHQNTSEGKRRRNRNDKGGPKGFVSVVDKEGNDISIPKDLFYSQTEENEEEREFVHNSTKEAFRRKNKDYQYKKRDSKCKGTIPVIDINGNGLRISKEVYYSQEGPKEEWCYLHNGSKEYQRRKEKLC